jgi:hypothetical protein
VSEFEDKLNGLLNDPGQMEKIAALAKSLMGGEDKPSGGGSAEAEPDMGLDADMIKKIAALMGKHGPRDSEQTALLNAMKPYLSEKRRAKMDKAMKLARLAGIAELAAGEFKGDGDV